MPGLRRYLPRCLFGGLLLALCLPVAQAGYYVYQLPDASRLMTDRPQRDKSLKLIKQTHNVSEVGRVAAAGFQASPAVNYLRFESLIYQVARRHEVDAALVKAVIRTESYFNPNATSRVGASGLMQLMPQTAAKYGVTDLYSPKQNIEAGVKHLKYLLQRYPDQLAHALAAYNAGEQAVDKYNGIPPYQETQNYVKKVMRFLEVYNDWP
jgi:soluble lytic murein transglycosylase-like protein